MSAFKMGDVLKGVTGKPRVETDHKKYLHFSKLKHTYKHIEKWDLIWICQRKHYFKHLPVILVLVPDTSNP